MKSNLNTRRGDKSNHSCTQQVISSCSTFPPSIIKIFRRIVVLQSGHKIKFKKVGEVTTKVRKSKVVILVRYTSSHPVLHLYQVSYIIFQRVFDLQSGQKPMHNHSNITKGDNDKSKKGRGIILVPDTSSRPTQHFYQIPNIIKFFQRVYIKIQRGHEINFKSKTKGENSKSKTPELVFLYMTRCLVLFYISNKFQQNIPKSIQVTEGTRNQCMITFKYNKGR